MTQIHGISATSPNSRGTVAALKTPNATIAPIQARPTITAPSSRPCAAPISRHHGSILSSVGSDSPMAAPSAAGISSARDRTAVRTVLDHGFGSGGPIRSASRVRALSISAC